MSNKNSGETTVLKALKGRQTKQVGISMPIELIERFDEMKKEMEGNGYTLVMSEICCDAVEKAIAKAAIEIAEILKHGEEKKPRISTRKIK